MSRCNILFFTRLFNPHVGGVEKQVEELSKRLVKRGFTVTLITEKYDEQLKSQEKVSGINVVRIKYPKVKYLGLIYVWIWLLRHISYIKNADIVHAHGNFIWYWPFRFIFLFKPAYVTFHGWEGEYPIPFKNRFIRKVDSFLAFGNITIHDYVEKYYGIKADMISYTAVNLPKEKKFKKDKKRLVYVGRLEENTGLVKILKALEILKGVKIDFVGDGPLKDLCQKIGTVHGFTDPNPFLKKAFICLSPGVTTILEAFSYKCLLITTYDNSLKRDYLLMTPFSKWIWVERTPQKMAERIKFFIKNPSKARKNIKYAYEWVKSQNWKKEVEMYLNLWGLENKKSVSKSFLR